MLNASLRDWRTFGMASCLWQSNIGPLKCSLIKKLSDIAHECVRHTGFRALLKVFVKLCHASPGDKTGVLQPPGSAASRRQSRELRAESEVAAHFCQSP